MGRRRIAGKERREKSGVVRDRGLDLTRQEERRIFRVIIFEVVVGKEWQTPRQTPFAA